MVPRMPSMLKDAALTTFVAAGPLVTMQTPGRPVTCAYPDAM